MQFKKEISTLLKCQDFAHFVFLPSFKIVDFSVYEKTDFIILMIANFGAQDTAFHFLSIDVFFPYDY